MLHDLYYPPNIIRVIDSRRIKWAQYVAGMDADRVLVRKSERNSLLGRPRRGLGEIILYGSYGNGI